MKLMLGEPIKVQPDKRMHDHVMDGAMRDVIDALVELITNADDSYGRLHRTGRRSKDQGPILIERYEQRKGKPSYIVVRDRAEGMSLTRMVEVLKSPGARTSGAGDRGYMGRGAKDCSRFGTLTLESIKNGRYYKCVLMKRAMEVVPLEDRSADQRDRDSLGITRGNGTVVGLEIGEEFKLPQLRTLCEELSAHFALQDILAETSAAEVLLRNAANPDEKPERIVSRRPVAEAVCEGVEYAVPGYAGVTARLSIYRAAEPFEEKAPRSRLYGLLIRGKRAIHERSLLCAEIERERNSRRYFGRIECDYIDVLLEEYENRRKEGEPHPASNPSLLVDPARRHGLEKDHPFTQALLGEPIARLQALLEEDRKKERQSRREIANQQTRDRLDRLAKAASRFLRQQIDELEELGPDEAVDNESFIKRGILIYPTFLNVRVGGERALSVYVHRGLLDRQDAPVEISSDSEAVVVIGSPVELRVHKKKDDRLLGAFRVVGRSVASDVSVTAKCNGLPIAEALVQVVEPKMEDRAFGAPLEFEREDYRVRLNSQKTLRLFAKVREVVSHRAEVALSSHDGSTVSVRSRCVLEPVAGTNYALAECPVRGKRLKAKTVVRASVNGYEASAEVKVIERSEDRAGPRIQIELCNEDFGNFRAQWGDHEGRPNVLRIAGRHASLARYLGAPGEGGNFPHQESPLYRVLLAEIVAEAVCRKSLRLEARERPWDFRWADLKDDFVISDTVVSQLKRRLREFLPIAHRAMVEPRDAKQPVFIGAG